MTTAAAARAAALGIQESRTGRTAVKSLQSYHAEIGGPDAPVRMQELPGTPMTAVRAVSGR